MIHLEIVGSSPRANTLLDRLDFGLDRPVVRTRFGSSPTLHYSLLPRRRVRRPALTASPPRDRKALQRTTLLDTQLPEPADQEVVPVEFAATVSSAITSFNNQTSITPTCSGRSSPLNAETQSNLSLSQGGWTTGNTTERSSLDSSCYSLDEFDRQAASTVHQHFEDFESMLYEGPRSREAVSSVYQECQEWSALFPHLRVLGVQLLAPQESVFHFVSPLLSTTPASTTTQNAESEILDTSDLSFSSDTQGLSLSGRKVKASRVPAEAALVSVNHDLPSSSRSNEYDFLHEEVFAQDGVYEDIIAIDYKDIYEDNMEHKQQITPRHRRIGYPPITPNACVKDSVISAVFDTIWREIMSWMRILLKKYDSEIVVPKKVGAGLSSGNIHAPTPSLRMSSFVCPSRPFTVQGNEGPISFDGVLKVTSMSLQNRNSVISEPSDSPMILNTPALVTAQKISRPSTVINTQRKFHGRAVLLAPIPDSRIPNEDTRRPRPYDALSVKQIMPTSQHRLSSPPSNFPRPSPLPPLEHSPNQPSQRRHGTGHRASSAIDNKDSRLSGSRERSNNAMEVNRPSTTQAFRSETPYGNVGSRRSSTPMGQNINARHPMNFTAKMSINGSALHPSNEVSSLPANILEDNEGPPLEDVRHNQWIPTTPHNNYYRRMKHLALPQSKC